MTYATHTHSLLPCRLKRSKRYRNHARNASGPNVRLPINPAAFEDSYRYASAATVKARQNRIRAEQELAEAACASSRQEERLHVYRASRLFGSAAKLEAFAQSLIYQNGSGN